MPVAVLAGMLGVAGCAQVQALKSKVNGHQAAAGMPSPARLESRPVLSFTAIVDELQHGYYAQGQRDLQKYIARHPVDHPAKAMLHQLEADPSQSLGPRSQAYVVRPGDSYSTLAARFLGDSGAFLILARYNGSSNPSMLRAGDTIRLPLSTALGTGTTLPEGGKFPAASATNPLPASSDEGSSRETPSAKAQRLQRESMSLLARGKHDQAMLRLGEALSIEPGLKPAGPQAIALRGQLLASYHERAILLYRDQQLAPAISLWDRILAIDPDYEPAQIYRARAIELQHRLKQL